MNMLKKDKFKEDFIKYADSVANDEDWQGNLWKFIEPHLKLKNTKIKLEIPQDKLTEFNELWPSYKLPTGKYGRCSIPELNSAFIAFFKQFPTYTDWSIIFQAAYVYLAERERENYAYTRRSKYFVRKEASDKSFESELGEYYQRIIDGTQEQPQLGVIFEPKVY